MKQLTAAAYLKKQKIEYGIATPSHRSTVSRRASRKVYIYISFVLF